jgi:hypothetical protein
MSEKPVHQCECAECQKPEAHSDREWHRHLNLLMSRLDEQQRRWLAAAESQRLGHGGDRLLSTITGLDEKTIRKGRTELDEHLQSRPTEKVRLSGGGRTEAKKKISS